MAREIDKYDRFMTDTAVDCFALRFVQDSGTERLALYSSWYGVIRHVQSGAEDRFTKSDDAIRFLNSYIHFASLDEEESE